MCGRRGQAKPCRVRFTHPTGLNYLHEREFLGFFLGFDLGADALGHFQDKGDVAQAGFRVGTQLNA